MRANQVPLMWIIFVGLIVALAVTVFVVSGNPFPAGEATAQWPTTTHVSPLR